VFFYRSCHARWRTPLHENGYIVTVRFDVAVLIMVSPSPHLEFGAGT
jgi:hypothetical protein